MTVQMSATNAAPQPDNSNSTIAAPLNFIPTQTQLYDDLLKQQSIGLVTADEYKRKKQIIDTVKRNAQQQVNTVLNKAQHPKPVKKQRTKLSFADTDDTDTAPPPPVVSVKNPALDTTHLPDTQRTVDIEAEKQRLREQWLAEQEQLKKSPLTVLYSYFDGTSHRHSVTVKHSDTVDYFLHTVKHSIKQKYTELNAKNAELMFVKCDVILPNNLTFYDLITNQISDKTRVLADFGPDSYPPKVMLREYYNRHRHVYPYKDYIQYTTLFKDTH